MTRIAFIKRTLAALLVGVSLVCGAAPGAWAVSTRVWVTGGFSSFNAGRGEGVLITSTGRLVRGEPTQRQVLSDVSMVFSMLEADGALYLGTGSTGEVWIQRGVGNAKKLASLPGAVIVTCLTRGPAGVIYAGTLPEGRVYKIATGTGQATLLVKLDAEHVWSLLYQQRSRTLFAATGSKGKLFAITPNGRARVYWESQETHLLSMAEGPGGALYVGSAPKAIVYRVLGPRRVLAVHDFAGNEIRALVGNSKTLFVAVNKMRRDRSSLFKFPASSGGVGTSIKGKRGKKFKLPVPRLGAKKGSGGIFALDILGSAKQLYGLTKGYFTSLDLVSGRLYAGEGTLGRVITIFPDDSVATAHDVKERQVLALSMGGKIRAFGTADGAAVYRAGIGRSAPTYTSIAFDSGNVSRFGVIAWRATGGVGVQTRSGNTAAPDAGWSAWRPVAGRGGRLGGLQRGAIRSPPARYLQYRILWRGRSQAQVQQVRLHYTPINRAPVWTSLTVGETTTSVEKATWVAKDSTAAPESLKIDWKIVDPDGDPLVYRVSYRAVGDVLWRRIGTAPFETGTSVKWRTDTLPDGWYEVRVSASDEKSNSLARSLSKSRTSAPVLVDHNKPTFVGLRVAYPVVTGQVRDSFSRISGVSYSLDGRLWRQVDAVDGNFDQEAERFNFRIRSALKPGLYTLLVRAYDAAGNAQVAKRTLRIR